MSDSKKPIDRFTCIFHLLLQYLHVLTMIPPPKTPRIFFHNSNFSNDFSPTPFKMGKFCWSNLWFASSSSYQPADLTSPSQQRPPSLQEVVQPAPPAKWRNHRRVKPQVVKSAKSTEKNKMRKPRDTHLKCNIAPEDIPSQKESSLPTIIFQGLC